MDKEKPITTKATYAEIEHFYRNRVPKFIPVANGVLEKFGFEVAQVQLNDFCWRTVEFPLNPSDVDPERDVMEKEVRSDFLREFVVGRPNYEYGGDFRKYGYYQFDGHTLIPVLFIRPKGSSVGPSDLVPVEDLLHSEFYPVRGAKEESPDGWETWKEDVWDSLDLAICTYGVQGEEEQDLDGVIERDSPEFRFYKALSKSAAWIVNVPLLEALLELGIKRTFSEESVSPGLGEVLSRKEFYIEPLVVLALPWNGGSESFLVSEEEVERLVLSLRSALATSSSIIVNKNVRSVFQEGMEGIISESLEVLFLPSREDSVVSYTPIKLKASSSEEVERAVSLVFDKFSEAHRLLVERNLLVGKAEGTYSKSPVYAIQVEPFQDIFKKNPPNPISLPNEGSFSNFLSPLNGISVEESYFTYRKGYRDPKTSSGRSYYTENETVVNLLVVGTKSSTPAESTEEGEENFNVTYSPNDFVLSEDFLPIHLEYLNPSLDPRFTLHTYLFPLIPSLFYYGFATILRFASILSSKDSGSNKVKFDLSVFSSFNAKRRSPEENEGVGESFINTFSTRVLELSGLFLKNVWEGILEERHRKYLEASENFLKVVSPKEDRISTAVRYKTYRYAGGLIKGVLNLGLVVKYRQDEEFVSAVKDLIIQATLLLAEIGEEVEVNISFIY